MRIFAASLLLLAAPAWAGEWKTLGTFDGTKVERREEPEGPPTLRCTFVFDAPLEKVKPLFASLQWERWMNDLKVFRILSRDDDRRVAFAYGRHKVPWPLKERDYVVKLTWEESPDAFTIQSRSASGVGPEPSSAVVRLEPRATWALTRVGDQTRFVYTYKGGAGGKVPDWMVESNYRSEGPRSIRKMVKLLEGTK